MSGRVTPELFVGLEVRRSGDHGAGIFLTEPVEAGEPILAFGGPILDRNEYLARPEVDHCIQIGIDVFLGPSGDLDDFTNHSCDPNARIEVVPGTSRALMVARLALETGAEATFDYSTVQLEDPRFVLEECRCGAASCRGRVGDFSQLTWAEKTRLYAEGLCVYYVAEAYRCEAADRGVTIREPRRR